MATASMAAAVWVRYEMGVNNADQWAAVYAEPYGIRLPWGHGQKTPADVGLSLKDVAAMKEAALSRPRAGERGSGE